LTNHCPLNEFSLKALWLAYDFRQIAGKNQGLIFQSIENLRNRCHDAREREIVAMHKRFRFKNGLHGRYDLTPAASWHTGFQKRFEPRSGLFRE
jgi:hypothetical protein